MVAFPDLEQQLTKFNETKVSNDPTCHLDLYVKKNMCDTVLSEISFYGITWDVIERHINPKHRFSSQKLKWKYHYIRFKIMQILRTGKTPEMDLIRRHFKSRTLSTLLDPVDTHSDQ